MSPGIYGIASGKSPRGDWNHSVVVDWHGNIAHDPNPDGGGLDGVAKEIHFLVPLTALVESEAQRTNRILREVLRSNLERLEAEAEGAGWR